MEIRVLARQGHSIRSIARHTGLSRQAVRKYLQRSPEQPRYGPRQPRATKLDPFKPYLLERIAAARPQWIPASVLFQEIVQRGYLGSSSVARAWIGQHRSRAPLEPLVRFETEPGIQMQADFTVIRRGQQPLLALVATLGFSRASFVRFVGSEDATTLCQCLRAAFEYFGGVPQQILFDNAKSVIIARDSYGEGQHRWNRELLDLASTYGFTPKVCRPYRAKTKGKVERFNGYLKRSFVLPLSVTLRQAGLALDCDLANAHIGRWLQEVAHRRTHGTTGQSPEYRLVAEREKLLPLPRQPVFSALPVHPSAPGHPIPVESIQHPLALYDALLEAAL